MCRHSGGETLCGVSVSTYASHVQHRRRFRLFLCPATQREIMSRLQVLGRTRLDNAGMEPGEIQRQDYSPRNRGSQHVRHQSQRRRHAPTQQQQQQQQEEDRVLSALAAECGLQLQPRDFPHLAPILRKKLADQIRYMLKRAAHRGEIVNGAWAAPVAPLTDTRCEAVGSAINSLEPPSLSRNIANAQNEGIIIDLLTQRFRSVM